MTATSTPSSSARRRRSGPHRPFGLSAARHLASPVEFDLLVCVAISAALCITVGHAGVSGDTWWQVDAGQWMLAHHRVLTHQIGYWSGPARWPWHSTEWGFQVVLAAAVKAFGPTAFVAVGAGIPIATLAVATIAIRRRTTSVLWRTAGVAYVGVALSTGATARPQVFGYLCFAAVWLLLDRKQTSVSPPWAVVAILFAWSNLHDSFVLGAALVAFDAVRYRMDHHRLPTSRRWFVPAAVIATTASPFGFAAAWTNGSGIAGQALMRNSLIEWMPPNLHVGVPILLAGAPMVGLAAIAAGRRSPAAAARRLELAAVVALYVGFLYAYLVAPYLAVVASAVMPSIGTAADPERTSAVMAAHTEPAAGSPSTERRIER